MAKHLSLFALCVGGSLLAYSAGEETESFICMCWHHFFRIGAHANDAERDDERDETIPVDQHAFFWRTHRLNTEHVYRLPVSSGSSADIQNTLRDAIMS